MPRLNYRATNNQAYRLVFFLSVREEEIDGLLAHQFLHAALSSHCGFLESQELHDFFLLRIPHIYLIGSGCLNSFYIAWSFTAIKSVPAQVDYHTLRFQGSDINILCLG